MYGLTREMTAQVIGELCNRGVALRGLLGERLEYDRIEIALERVDDSRLARAARCGGIIRHYTAGPWRIDGEDRLLELRRRLQLQLIWPLPGEQFVQHHAERVDVGRGREGLAPDLLGTGVIGRQRAARKLRELR